MKTDKALTKEAEAAQRSQQERERLRKLNDLAIEASRGRQIVYDPESGRMVWVQVKDKS